MAHTEEAKKRISEAMKLIRRSETAEQRRRRNPGRPHTAESKQKLREKALGRKHSPEARLAISRGKKGKTHKRLGPESIEKIRQKALGRKHTPEAIAKMIGHPAYHAKGKRFIHKGIRMRSSYEVRTASALDALGIKWEYEPKRFWFDKFTYTPDFLVDGSTYWEVKGWFNERSREKVNAFRLQYPEIPLVVFNLACLEALEASAGRTMSPSESRHYGSTGMESI
jgi:hypothetical protein